MSSSASSGAFSFAYDSDGLGDAADRARLAELPEADREEEIYERLERRRQAKSLFDMNTRLRREGRERRRAERRGKYVGVKRKRKKKVHWAFFFVFFLFFF
jgi:hypothetical protein